MAAGFDRPEVSPLRDGPGSGLRCIDAHAVIGTPIVRAWSEAVDPRIPVTGHAVASSDAGYDV